MNSMVDSLFDQYDRGRMTRRHLVQALAALVLPAYETNDEGDFAEPGDMTLLGVRTLGGFGVMVDNIGHRFLATSTIVASGNHAQIEM